MKKRDYYEILGVSTTASQQEIKKRYRRLALKLHPDRNPNDKISEDAFKEITEAYGILSNPQKRSRYDKRADSSSSRPLQAAVMVGMISIGQHPPMNCSRISSGIFWGIPSQRTRRGRKVRISGITSLFLLKRLCWGRKLR